MSSYSRTILVGNLGQNPDVKHTQDGRVIVNLSVATSESWRDKNTGDKKEKTEWHRVVIFNENIAKVAEQYLRKGAKVLIEGKNRTRKWTDQQGVDRYTTEIVVENFDGRMQMLGGKNDESGVERSNDRSQSSRGKQDNSDMDDQIPF